jgi:hypothetical protein
MFSELAVFMNCDAIKQGYVLLTSETLGCSFEKYKRYKQNCRLNCRSANGDLGILKLQKRECKLKIVQILLLNYTAWNDFAKAAEIQFKSTNHYL